MTASRPVAHPQLETLARELDVATARARALAVRASDATFHQRPDPPGWSAAECLEHLTLSNRMMLPRIDQAIIESSQSERRTNRKYRRDLVGWFLSSLLEPPFKQKFKTVPPFIPTSAGTTEQLLAEFSETQARLVEQLNRAAGYDLHRVKVTSPFNNNVRYNVYSTFRVITSHQRRHLYQAEMALLR